MPSGTGNPRIWVREPSYLPVLALAGTLPRVVAWFSPERLPAGGPPLSVLLFVVLMAWAAILWFAQGNRAVRDRRLGIFVLLLGLVWLWSLVAAGIKGDGISPIVLLLPLVLAMVALKPTSFGDTRRALAATAVVLAAGTWIAYAVMTFRVGPGEWMGLLTALPPDMTDSWIDPLSARAYAWGGPFGSPNVLGQVGVYIVLAGAAQTRRLRWMLVGSGLFFLAISASETAMLALVAGVAALAVPVVMRQPGRRRGLIVAGALTAAVAAVVVFVLSNPTLSGRTDVWPRLIEMWSGSPFVGVPQSVLNQRVEAGEIPAYAAIHAHNALLDTLVRTGLIGLVLALGVLGTAAWINGRATMRGFAAGMALLVAMSVIGISERVFTWGAVSTTNTVLLLGVAASAAWLRASDASRDLVAYEPQETPD